MNILALTPLSDTDQKKTDDSPHALDEEVDAGLCAIPERSMRLGELLTKMGCLDEDGLRAILAMQQRSGKPFGTCARALGLASRKNIRDAISIQYGAHFEKCGELNLPRTLAALHAPLGRDAEQFRLAGTRLLMNRDSAARELLTVSSVGGKNGSDWVAANLAIAVTQLGRKTLLVDADLQTGQIHRQFARRPRQGIVQYVKGQCALSEALLPSPMRRLSILPNGEDVLSAQPILAGDDFAKKIMALTETFDTVIVNGGNIRNLADNLILWSLTRSVILTMQRHKTRAGDVKKAMEGLANSNAQLAGAILTE